MIQSSNVISFINRIHEKKIVLKWEKKRTQQKLFYYRVRKIPSFEKLEDFSREWSDLMV